MERKLTRNHSRALLFLVVMLCNGVALASYYPFGPPGAKPPGARKSRAVMVIPRPERPLSGTNTAVNLLVRFPDSENQATHTVPFYNKFFEPKDPSNPSQPSLYDYFSEQSYGRFHLSGRSFGWFLIPNNDSTVSGRYRTKASYQGKELDLVKDLVYAAETNGIDFSKPEYDKDGDGILDHLIITHAVSADGASSDPFYPAFAYSFTMAQQTMFVTRSGVKIDSFMMVAEYLTEDIGTYCHESGHIYGLPDLYDADRNNPSSFLHAGAGIWTLMAIGDRFSPNMPPGIDDPTFKYRSPGNLDPWCKWRLGWLTPTVKTGNVGLQELLPAEDSAAVFKLFAKGDTSSKEYFLLENRQQKKYDYYLPGSGMLIWHVDEAVVDAKYLDNIINEDPQHKGVGIIEADDNRDLDLTLASGGVFTAGNYGDPGDLLPGTSNIVTFDRDSTPSSRMFNGDDSGVSLTGVALAGATGNASVMLNVNAGLILDPRISILEPEDRLTTENQTPSIIANFTDSNPSAPGFDPDTVVLRLNGVEKVSKALGNVAQYFDTASGRLNYVPPVPLDAGPYTITVDGTDLLGNAAPTATRYFSVRPRQFDVGLYMMSVPYVLSDADPTHVLGLSASMFRMATWDSVNQYYLHYPTSFTTFERGRGYWVKLFALARLLIQGQYTDPFSVFPMQFAQNTSWQQIGCPFPFAVDWNSAQVEYKGRIVTLQTAVDEGWISPTLYSYGSSGYEWSTAPEGELLPFQGYWVKKKISDAFTLRILPMKSGTRAPASRQRAAADGWRLRLSASANGLEDAQNYLGVTERETRSSRVEDPPAAPEHPSLYFVGKDSLGRAVKLAQDLRSSASPSQTWNFQVEATPGADVVLSWEGLNNVPKRCRLWLRDLEASRTVYVRSTAAHRFSMGPSGVARFEMRAETASSALLAINQLRMGATRGALSEVSWTLTEPAQVTVEVLNVSGRVVRKWSCPGVAGLNRIGWDGKDQAGRLLASGVYLCQLTAATDSGQAVRAVRSFVR